MDRRVRAAAGVVATVMATTGAAFVPASGATVGRVPTITATVTAKAIRLSSGPSTHAGRVRFHVTTPAGDHVLQLLKLRDGYTATQFRHDINLAFEGRLAAIRRIDRRVFWAGGAEARPNHPGTFAETLYAGTYYVLDQNGGGVTKLHVEGTPPPRAWISNSSVITGTQADRFRSPSTLPHRGWTLFRDTADEPHFLVFQQVKPGTTRKMVSDYFASGSQQQPAFALPATTSSGVISPSSQVLFHYSLPRGRYVMLCFWPSDETGMPHALMGMFRLVNLR